MNYTDFARPFRDLRRFFFCSRCSRVTLLFIIAMLVISIPIQAFALMNYNLDDPIGYRRANSAIDIIYDGTYVWLATPEGVSGTSDRGETWITYDASNGLNASDVAAVAYSEGRLWVASAHNEPWNDTYVPWGDGFNVTENDGFIWESYKPSQATDPNMLAYDIAVLDSAVWATCFAGGLIRSLDGGENWHNIFGSTADSIDFVDELFQNRSNLYYSVVIDTFFQDSAVVWAGSAAGIHKYLYIGETRKLAGNRMFDVSVSGDSTTWFAADGGVSRGLTYNRGVTYQFRTWDSDHGLLGDLYTAIEADSGLVVAAARDIETDDGLGFDISTDNGVTWYSAQPDQVLGQGKLVNEILKVGDAVFAACSEGGLIRSVDDGMAWTSIFPFGSDTSPDKPYNRFYSLSHNYINGDTVELWAGCDTGIIVFTFDDVTADPYMVRHIPLVDSDTSGQSVRALLVWDLDTTLVWDTDTFDHQVWVATHPVDDLSGDYAVLRSLDFGETWQFPLQSAQAYDFNIAGRVFRIGLTGSLLESANFGSTFSSARLYDENAQPIDSAYRSIEYDPANSTIWFANGQVTARIGNTYGGRVERVTTDPLKYDRHWRYDRDLDGLSGDFITALGLERHNGVTTIWAATQRTEEGINGVTTTTNGGVDWIVRKTGVRVWNFAAGGGDAYFAADEGLFAMMDGEDEFTRITVRDENGREISDNAEFYSCRIVGDDLWIGSSDGIAVMNAGDTTVFRDFLDEEKPYATPVPVSPSKGLGFVRFHYKLSEPANVTIKVYDFAMNLVRVVIDNEPREPRDGLDRVDDDTWDLLNGNNHMVAAGAYYFLVETSTGYQEWGKLMVLP